jgi:pimeloyl-ACP methyl ester carboxylesterase
MQVFGNSSHLHCKEIAVNQLIEASTAIKLATNTEHGPNKRDVKEKGAAVPTAAVRGVGIEYEVLGDTGPWILLTQGGRQDKELFRPLAEHLAAGGYRVIQHDRRNSGASDISIQGEGSEEEIFADDMYELCAQLGALPVIACGGAGGSRHSILLALRHPRSTRALLLWWPSGSRGAAENLAELYYGQYITAARSGGMQAVAETPYYAERISRVPANRERLLSLDVDQFIAAMERWRKFFLDGADLPVIGVNDETLKSVTLPTCIIPGYDFIHPQEIGESLARVLPNAELHYLPPQEQPQDPEARAKARQDHQHRLADTFLTFLEKNVPRKASAESETS